MHVTHHHSTRSLGAWGVRGWLQQPLLSSTLRCMTGCTAAAAFLSCPSAAAHAHKGEWRVVR